MQNATQTPAQDQRPAVYATIDLQRRDKPPEALVQAALADIARARAAGMEVWVIVSGSPLLHQHLRQGPVLTKPRHIAKICQALGSHIPPHLIDVLLVKQEWNAFHPTKHELLCDYLRERDPWIFGAAGVKATVCWNGTLYGASMTAGDRLRVRGLEDRTETSLYREQLDRLQRAPDVRLTTADGFFAEVADPRCVPPTIVVPPRTPKYRDDALRRRHNSLTVIYPE